MNCTDAQHRLSDYHDDELSPDEATHVAAHLAYCAGCAEALAEFEQLSSMSRRLVDPPAPSHMWDGLAAQLDAQERPYVRLARWLPSHVPGGYFALAASLLIAVGVGVVAYQAAPSPAPDHLAVNLDRFLQDFSDRPGEAQQLFLAEYNGRRVTLNEATNALGYQPKAARGLPEDWSVETTYLLEMPCCTCAQVICRNKEGKSIAIFEHAMDQPIWFGDRPAVKCRCLDVPTSVIQAGDQIAATWREGERYITVIGATDLAEVTELVGHFQGI